MSIGSNARATALERVSFLEKKLASAADPERGAAVYYQSEIRAWKFLLWRHDCLIADRKGEERPASPFEEERSRPPRREGTNLRLRERIRVKLGLPPGATEDLIDYKVGVLVLHALEPDVCADALAYEVDKLVVDRKIDSRSPAADAFLDYVGGYASVDPIGALRHRVQIRRARSSPDTSSTVDVPWRHRMSDARSMMGSLGKIDGCVTCGHATGQCESYVRDLEKDSATLAKVKAIYSRQTNNMAELLGEVLEFDVLEFGIESGETEASGD